MALPNVSISVLNGNLGRVAVSDDRTMGLIVSGFDATGWVVGTPKVIYSPSDLLLLIAGMDITTAAVVDIIRQVNDFYKAAPLGSPLWIAYQYPQSTLSTALSSGVVRAMMEASGGKIACIGFAQYPFEIPVTPTLVSGIDADVWNSLDEAQALATQLTADHMPVRLIVEGRYWNGSTSTLGDLRSLGFNRVSVLLTSGSTPSPTAAMGLLLGRLAATAPNISIGRVKDGPVMTDVPYLMGGALVNTKSAAQQGVIHDKGYIFLRTFPHKAGYYWNDDPVAAPLTDDYFSLSNGRVIDKAARIAYATFVEEMNDTVLVDDKGKILKTTMKQYQSRIERAIGLTMGVNQEISGVTAFVDPDQDILATSQLIVDLRITPTGTNRSILVRLGLYNPNAS